MKDQENTKKRIADCLVTKLQRFPLDLIAIKDLCHDAKVCRTSFYNNFGSKEDVLRYIYKKAHHAAFRDKFKDLSYIYSDDFIKDMIRFFDDNADLLFILYKWNIIDIIARYNTEMCLLFAERYEDEIIRKNAEYFVCYTSTALFNICTLWILNNKEISSDELFFQIKYYQDLKSSLTQKN